MCLVKLIKFKQMINTHYRAKSNGLWVYGELYNNCDRGVNQNYIVTIMNILELENTYWSIATLLEYQYAQW